MSITPIRLPADTCLTQAKAINTAKSEVRRTLGRKNDRSSDLLRRNLPLPVLSRITTNISTSTTTTLEATSMRTTSILSLLHTMCHPWTALPNSRRALVLLHTIPKCLTSTVTTTSKPAIPTLMWWTRRPQENVATYRQRSCGKELRPRYHHQPRRLHRQHIPGRTTTTTTASMTPTPGLGQRTSPCGQSTVLRETVTQQTGRQIAPVGFTSVLLRTWIWIETLCKDSTQIPMISTCCQARMVLSPLSSWLTPLRGNCSPVGVSIRQLSIFPRKKRTLTTATSRLWVS